MRSLMTAVLIFAMVLPSFGCADARDKWTPGDRFSLNQSLQGTQLGITGLETLRPMVMDRPAALEVLDQARSTLVTVELNLAATEEIHGPPAEIVPFSELASKKAREEQKKDHTSTDWLGILQKVGMGIAGALTLAATVLNLPYIGPWLATTKAGQFAARVVAGKTVAVAQDALKTISVMRSEAEVRPLGPKDVVRLAVANFSPSTAAIADKVSNQIEAANKIVVTPIRQLETAAV